MYAHKYVVVSKYSMHDRRADAIDASVYITHIVFVSVECRCTYYKYISSCNMHILLVVVLWLCPSYYALSKKYKYKHSFLHAARFTLSHYLFFSCLMRMLSYYLFFLFHIIYCSYPSIYSSFTLSVLLLPHPPSYRTAAPSAASSPCP